MTQKCVCIQVCVYNMSVVGPAPGGNWGLTQQHGPWRKTPADLARAAAGSGEPAIGGGVPAGGTKHAGHASYLSVINPYSVNGRGLPPRTPAYMQQRVVSAYPLDIAASQGPVGAAPVGQLPNQKTPSSKIDDEIERPQDPGDYLPPDAPDAPGKVGSKPGPGPDAPGKVGSKPGPLPDAPGKVGSKPGPLPDAPGKIGSAPDGTRIVGSNPNPPVVGSRPEYYTSRQPGVTFEESQYNIDRMPWGSLALNAAGMGVSIGLGNVPGAVAFGSGFAADLLKPYGLVSEEANTFGTALGATINANSARAMLERQNLKRELEEKYKRYRTRRTGRRSSRAESAYASPDTRSFEERLAAGDIGVANLEEVTNDMQQGGSQALTRVFRRRPSVGRRYSSRPPEPLFDEQTEARLFQTHMNEVMADDERAQVLFGDRPIMTQAELQRRRSRRR